MARIALSTSVSGAATSAVTPAMPVAVSITASGASSAALASPALDATEDIEQAVNLPRRVSDEVEGLQFEVRWEPVRNALGVSVSEADVALGKDSLVVVSWIYIS
jgi:hypothetical protein